MYDFSSGFNSINNAFANIGKQNEIAYKQQALAALGQDLASGNYASAAQKALASGDAGVGIAILGLGQKADERKAEAAWYAGNGGGGGMGQPLTRLGQPQIAPPLTRLGQPQIAPRGVQVANSEADVQRLEAQATGIPQLGQRSQRRGIRNANPGNIEAGPFSERQGATGSDGRFAQFGSPEEGIRAADNLLKSFAGRGLNTISGIVGRWAPPGENDTEAYIAQVSKEIGAAPDQPLDMNSPEVRQKLIAAKIRVENGSQPYAEDVFQRALNPNWQSEVASYEGGQQPVQVAQAPAQGAAPAQGFVIPGTTPQQSQSILSDPAVQTARSRYLSAPTERTRAAAKVDLDVAITDAKTRVDEGGPLTQEGRRLANEKARRELQGEQPIPLTPEERQKFGIRPDQAAYKTRDGIKFGPAGTTIVNEAQKLQGAEDKARVDVNTKFLGKLADSGPQVSQRMADMDVLAAVIRDAPPGPTADAQVFFDRIGAGLGFSKGELATRSDAMKAIVQRLAPAQREEGSGSTSDIEFKGMLASFPSLAATGEGRQMILTTIARQNEITRMRVEVADQWTQGEIPATEARKRIAQIDRASIYASEDEKKLIRKLAGTARGGDLGKASPAMTREVGGKLYEQRGGQWYAKEAN